MGRVGTAVAVDVSPVRGFPQELLGAKVGVAEKPPRRDVGVEATARALHAVRRRVRPGGLVAAEAPDLFSHAGFDSDFV